MQGLSFDEAWRLFDYDPETGVFKRRVKVGVYGPGHVVGTVDGKGYLHVNRCGQFIRLHRLAWFMFFGVEPSDKIDHINRICTDNRIANLRDCSQHYNNGNQTSNRKNTSGIRGVYWNQKIDRWHAQIKVFGKQTYIGSHKNSAVAAAWYNFKAVEVFGAFATLNHIELFGYVCLPPGQDNFAYAVHASTLATSHHQRHPQAQAGECSVGHRNWQDGCNP